MFSLLQDIKLECEAYLREGNLFARRLTERDMYSMTIVMGTDRSPPVVLTRLYDSHVGTIRTDQTNLPVIALYFNGLI